MTSKRPTRPTRAATLATSTVAVTFPKFPKLPFELQLIVWHFALPGPRIIQAKYRNAAKSRDIRRQKSLGLTSIDAQMQFQDTAMLRTCQNSRKIALKVYSVAFGRAFCNRGSIYFDFDRYTVYVRHVRPLASLEKDCGGVESDDDRQDFTKRLQHVMLQCHAGRVVGEILAKFEGLKTVTMQLNDCQNTRQTAINIIQFEVANSNEPQKRDKEAREKLHVEYIPQHQMSRLRVIHEV